MEPWRERTNLTIGTTSVTNFNIDYSEDVFLAKINGGGTVSWMKHYGGIGADTLGDMAIDPSINSSGVYLTGSFLSTNFAAGNTNLTRQNPGGSDSYTAKIDLNGNLLWINQGTYSSGDYIAVDVSNNCYVVGHVLGVRGFTFLDH